MVLVTQTWPGDDNHAFIAIADGFWHAERIASNAMAANAKFYRDMVEEDTGVRHRVPPSPHFTPVIHLTEI